MSKPDDARVTMTFTAKEWRILAIAAAGVPRSKYQHFTDKLEAGRLALVIAEETGKD